MAQASATVESAKESVKSSVQRHSWIEPLARFGYTTKGVIYGLAGVLATMVAFGAGGQTSGARGVLRAIADASYGKIILGAITIGLLGYVVWRFVQALYDAEDKGDDAKGIVVRTAYGISGFIYLALAFSAGRLVLGMGGGSGGSGGGSKQEITAELLATTWGTWLVGAVGIAFIIVGLRQFYRAYKASFMDDYKAGEMSASERTWAERVGRFGLSARGVTFCMIGSFIIQAALQSDASEAKGLGAAFSTLARQPYGPYLLGVVALGFVAYGVYCFSRARYRHFSTS